MSKKYVVHYEDDKDVNYQYDKPVFKKRSFNRLHEAVIFIYDLKHPSTPQEIGECFACIRVEEDRLLCQNEESVFVNYLTALIDKGK